MREQKEYKAKYLIDGLCNTINRIALVVWYGTTHVYTLLCLDPGGVQTAGIQWSSQIFYQCIFWPRQWSHLDG